MAAPKGNKFAGSRKGIKNKRTQQWEEFTAYCLEGGLERFREELDKLSGKDYVQVYLKLLEFHKPRIQELQCKSTDVLNITPIQWVL